MEIDLRNARPCPDCRQCLTNADKCHYCTERDQLRAEVERLRGDFRALDVLAAEQVTTATSRAEAAERNAEQYRQNWLALQRETGEDCQDRALEVIRAGQQAERERDEAIAHAADLRGALEAANTAIEQVHDEWAEPTSAHDAGAGQAAAICFAAAMDIEASLGRTPAQSLALIEARVLREVANRVLSSTCQSMIRVEADSIEKEATDGR